MDPVRGRAGSRARLIIFDRFCSILVYPRNMPEEMADSGKRLFRGGPEPAFKG